jgi:hypothetical protein
MGLRNAPSPAAEDARTDSLVRRVMAVASTMSLLALVLAILQVRRRFVVERVVTSLPSRPNPAPRPLPPSPPPQLILGVYFSVGLIAAVAIPLCGWCGAARRR